MQYFGGKQKIAKKLARFINSQLKPGQPFVDLFCGSANILASIDPNRPLIGNDIHKPLIALHRAIQQGKPLPDECTEIQYIVAKNTKVYPEYVRAFIGFGCSFAGKWWGGYARGVHDYCGAAKRGILNKHKNIKHTTWYDLDYREVPIPEGALIYCDIPYQGTTQYSSPFDHKAFYEWAENKPNVLVSEYYTNIRVGWKPIWCEGSRKSIRDAEGRQRETIEVLIAKCK